MYKNKYLKYKDKYTKLKNQIGGNQDCLYLDDKLTNEKITSFKEKLDNRSVQGYKNWLVIYAGYDTPKEKIRFKNPNWIFWDINKDERYSIKGSFNEDNLIKLDTILGNTFDYICFDDDINTYYPDDKNKLIFRLLKTLKPNGVLVIKNVLNFNDINEDDYAQQVFLSKKNRSTPYGTGYGGSNFLNDIVGIIRHIKEQKIRVNVSKYDQIEILNSFFDQDSNFAINFDQCQPILNIISKVKNHNLNSNTALHCKKFIGMYELILEFCKSNKEKLKEQYYKLLEEIVSLWEFPNYAFDDNDSFKRELFFIKKLDYPSNLYS